MAPPRSAFGASSPGGRRQRTGGAGSAASAWGGAPVCPRGARGFTLVEVLVALLVLAILASLAWQGLDAIVRSRDIGNEALDRTLRLNTVVTQWEQDLQSVQDVGAVPALAFDGQSLRLTRRVEGGVALVVWAVCGG
ncbi:MAG: prepilin-type N-terminal cleavage/methylation domain-containing protein, partial [Chitinophagaceae bacterium]|nr:prepilin-type N-terminal cleavage/methylation domain-containing protein [Rubrivivax sp.]